MMSSETQREMLKLLSVLKPIEADILRKRSGWSTTASARSRRLGTSIVCRASACASLQEQALGKMRKAMAKREML